MSTPGGYGGYGQDPNQQYDPLTGQPLQPGPSAAYPGPDTGGYQGLGQYPQNQYPPTSQYPQPDQYAQPEQYPQTGAYPSNFPTGGFPAGGFPQPPPPRKRTGLIVGVIAAVVVVAVGVTLTIVLLNKKSDDQAGGGGNPTTTTSATSTTSTTPTTTSTTPSGSGSGDPVYPGWQTVSVPTEGLAYDVPADWRVEPADTGSVSIDNSDATIEGVATYKVGACPGSASSFRAKVGAAPQSTEPPAQRAKEVAQTWADALAKAYKGKSATPQTTTEKVDRGQTDATVAAVRITTTKDSCNPPAMVVTVISFASGSDTESLVLFGDQDVPDQITPTLAAQVLTTARPAA